MIRYACGIAVAMVLVMNAQTGWSQQQYLYAPTPVVPETKLQGRDGILVQDVAVRKGDSLYKISRKFSGHGSYYPQILLFNDIKNPNRIYPGNVFKVPVSRNALSRHVETAPVDKERSVELRNDVKGAPDAQLESAQKQQSGGPVAASVTEIPTQDLKKVAAGRTTKKRATREKVAVSAKKQATREKQRSTTAAAGTSAAGQVLFERAVKAYRQDDCRTALELFETFLAENQGSPLAADASLYKADCYLKLSSQN